MTGSDRERPIPRSAFRVCVVGSGTYFLSGISYFTLRLVASLATRVHTSAILMRRLIPRALYPGKARVGAQLADLTYPEDVPVFDGIDWFWIPSIVNALRFLLRERPSHLIFQWWTGAVLHSFLVLGLTQRALGGCVVIEFHEVQDTGEAKLPLAHLYVSLFARLFMGLAHGFVLHSEYDRPFLERRFSIGQRPVAVIPHGPFDHHAIEDVTPRREAPPEACNVLFFGTIRPYKGLEDLVEAFEAACDTHPDQWWLTVVGETWEGWTGPIEMIRASRHRDRITLVNRYVADAEVSQWFAGADVVALPYRRSSASGPLHLSMSVGRPTIVTAVGGLPEAAKDYEGAVFVTPGDIPELAAALGRAAELSDRRFADPHSWDRSADALLDLLKETNAAGRAAA